MRTVFVKILIEEARQDSNLLLLTADLGYRALEEFQDEFPDRLINVGVAEQNMIGVATGLALSGKNVCVYSIVPFVTFRCFEQIRNNISHNNLNIKIIGVGGGFSYGNQGMSHNTTEDFAVMRTLPNFNILCPGDKIEAELVIKAMFNDAKPAYIRLGKAPNISVYETIPKFKIGEGLTVKEGHDITILSVGNIIENVIQVAKKLDEKGVSAQVISFPYIKPLNYGYIENIAKNMKPIFTVEEHGAIGGFGSSISELLMESKFSGVFFKKIALPDICHNTIGSQIFLREKNGLNVDAILNNILNYVQ
jgi:transketolase